MTFACATKERGQEYMQIVYFRALLIANQFGIPLGHFLAVSGQEAFRSVQLIVDISFGLQEQEKRYNLSTLK